MPIAASWERPPQWLIWWKIPPKEPTKIWKKKFEKFAKFSRNLTFSKKTTSLQSQFWANETKISDKIRGAIVSWYVEPSFKEKNWMGLFLGVEQLRTKVMWYFHDSVYEVKVMSYDNDLLHKSLLKYNIKGGIWSNILPLLEIFTS